MQPTGFKHPAKTPLTSSDGQQLELPEPETRTSAYDTAAAQDVGHRALSSIARRLHSRSLGSAEQQWGHSWHH